MKVIARLLALLIGLAAFPALAAITPSQLVLWRSLPVVTILPNGFTAQILFKGTVCGGSGAYNLLPNTTPTVTLDDAGPSYNSSGTLVVGHRSLVATSWYRKPYPDNTTAVETQTSVGCAATVVLSDYVNPADTVTVSAVAGAYTGSTAFTAQQAVNQSTFAFRPPVCKWVSPPNVVIAPGAKWFPEITCFSDHPGNFNQLSLAKFSLSDGTNTVSCSATTITKLSQTVSSGNATEVQGYACPAGIDPTTLTAGGCGGGASCQVTGDFTAYPRVGTAVIKASTGQDGVAIAASVRTPNLHPLQIVWDQASKYPTLTGWICPAGGTGCAAGATGSCATTSCIHTDATDPGTAAAANYASFYTFAHECSLYRAANQSLTDTSNCVGLVRCNNTAINGYDPTNSLRTLTAGNAWLIFKAAPGCDRTNVIVSRAATSTGSGLVNDRTWFENIGFTQVDATASAYNQEIIGGDGANNNPINTEIVCNLCGFTVNANEPIIFQVAHPLYYNISATEGTHDGNIGAPFSTEQYGPEFFGGTMTAAPGSGRLNIWPFTTVGLTTNGFGFGWHNNVSTNWIVPTGVVVAFNKIMASDIPFDIDTPIAFAPANFADVQNIYEKIGGDALYAHRFLGDLDATPFQNYIAQNLIVVGGRGNILYNDGGSTFGSATCTPKQGVQLYNVYGAMAGQGYNIKSDMLNTFGRNGARVCNWNPSYGVGDVGDVAWKGSDGVTAPAADGTSFLGMFFGLPGRSDLVGYGQQVSFVSDQSAGGTGTGNGNYLFSDGTADPAYRRVPAGGNGLPDDLVGTPWRGDGTDYAGALEN